MIEVGGAVAAAVLLWWASTGALLYLDGLPRRTFKWSLLTVSLLGALALWAAASASHNVTAQGAYIGFTSGLVVWAVPTALFYFGVATGSRRTPLPPGVKGRARFRAATETVLHHEAACALGAIALAVTLDDAPNKLALWTYIMLWAMHVSGKLNMYFGVPNLSEEFLPSHLAYLETYMRRRPMNLFFPFAISLATAAVLYFAGLAWISPAGTFAATAATLLAVLAALALLEHWLLVLPLSPMTLWTWSLRSRTTLRTPTVSPAFESGQPPD